MTLASGRVVQTALADVRELLRSVAEQSVPPYSVLTAADEADGQ